MRIISIHTFYKNHGGGEDVVFNNEAKLLRDNGHDVECLVFSNESIGGRISQIVYFFKSIYNSRSAWVLKKRIRAFQPDIIHVHNTFFVASPAVFRVAKKYGIPVVHTLHNYRLICPSATLYHNGKIYTESTDKLFPIKAILRKIYRESMLQTTLVVLITAIHKLAGTYKNCIDRFIILNNFSKPIFEKSSLRIDKNKMVFKPNYVDEPTIVSSKKEDYYIFLGRLTQEKGVLTMLEAFKSSGLKIKIFGSGELEHQVLNASERNENIEFHGFKERSELMQLISSAKALIFPSEWYETFGLTIIEAFSVGTPVIVSDIGGHSELVLEGINGFHFKAGDPEDLNSVLEKFEDHENKDQMSINAKKEYALKYTPEKNYNHLIEIYNSLIH
ncbi:glycosyltransferase family 4 protein [Hyphobacterium sp. CCMP332]|nr:glycosyltransferase family 4 protein [Hyphobacterium sp. CCMP332]